MDRKRYRLSRNTKGNIVNQAIELFLEKGYHGTSIHDISKATRLTKALYWYFKSKEELLKRII